MRWPTAVFITVLALAQAALTSTAVAAGGQVGTKIVYPDPATSAAGSAQAFPSTSTASGEVDRLNLYLDGSNTAGRVEIGLYSGTSSRAGRLRGRCVVTSPTPDAWNRCTFPAYTIRESGRYWLALLHPAGYSGTLKYREGFVSGASTFTSRSSGLSSLPPSWTNGANRENYRPSVYADLAVTQPPPPPAQCADGSDNDRDGLVDLNDPGCTSASDNDESNPPPPPPPPSAADAYHVSGRNLYDPCGERVIVRGVEQMFWQTTWILPSFVDEIGRTGANTVRVLPQISAPTPDGGQPLSLAGTEDLIRRGIQSHMLVDVAINGGKDPDIYLRSDVKTMLLKYEKNIVIHAVGEAYESTGSAWATRVKGVISRLRAGGYKAPLYIMSIDGGRNLPAILTYGADIFASDPLKNVVFGWQAYWGSSNYYQNRYGMTLAQAMARVRDAPVPIQVGLLRHTDGAETMNYSPVMADAQTYGIGWLWWDWRMSTDNLTTSGIYGAWAADGYAVVLGNPNGIGNTSVRTYFQRNNACPTGAP
jgi:mannan endo-1,4-beta-mannosidase